MPMLGSPLLPVIQLQKTDESFFTCNCHSLGSRDFSVIAAKIKPAYDLTGGTFEITIAGKDGSNAEANNILNNVEEGFETLTSIGKTSSTTDVLRGLTEKIEIEEPSATFMRAKFTGWDFGTDIMMGRIINLYHEQKRLDDGVTQDPADTSTKLKNITLQLLGKRPDGTTTDLEAYPGDKDNISNRFSVADQGIIVNAANISETSRAVPLIDFKLMRLTDALAQINAMNDTVCYVRPNKEFVMHSAVTASYSGAPSGVLITDSHEDPLLTGASPWAQDKYGLMRPGSVFERSLEYNRKRIFAVDQTKGHPDQSNEDDVSGQNVDTKFWAMRFTPLKRNCSAIAVKVGKIGTPIVPLRVELREDYQNTPNGSIIAESEKLPGSIAPNEFTAALSDWEYYPVGKELNTRQNYWIVINPTTDASNCYQWRRDSAATFTNADSTDGETWTVRSNSYGFDFRQDYYDDVVTIFPFGVTSTHRHVWEEIIRKQTLNNEGTMFSYLLSQYTTLSQRKETIRCAVKSPDILLQPGMEVRVHKHASGYQVDGNFTITGIVYNFASTPDMATGTFDLDLTMSRFVSYGY